jgi:hypothetical protein
VYRCPYWPTCRRSVPPQPHLTAIWGPCVSLCVFPQSRHALALLQQATRHVNPAGIVPHQPNPGTVRCPDPRILPVRRFMQPPPLPQHSTTCVVRVAPTHAPLAAMAGVAHTPLGQCAPGQASASTGMPFEATACAHHSKASSTTTRTPVGHPRGVLRHHTPVTRPGPL